MNTRSLAIVSAISLLVACGGTDASPSPDIVTKTDATYRAEITTEVQRTLLVDIRGLIDASKAICAAAPVVHGRGWSAALDREAIANMKNAWYRARTAYEHIEGALATLFPEIDKSIDYRYDDFLADLGAAGDSTPFDAEGVTGMHAIERIIFSDVTPQRIIDVEKTIPGYTAARFPQDEMEALAFQAELCAKLVSDARNLETQWSPQNIGLPDAYQGLVRLMTEQREKVTRASSSEEESRYAQTTMADLRANLEGTRRVYEAFRPWLKSHPDGSSIDTRVVSGFESLSQLYSGYLGDALPPVPATWSSENPSPADRATPFGTLWTQVRATVDPNRSDSLVQGMNEVAVALGIGDFKTQ